MTYIQLINTVLRKLREDQVTSSNQSDYSALIGDYINEAKREVEDAWNWVQLRTTIQITTAGDSSTFRYVLTGAGNRSRVLQVINDTEDYELRRAPYKWMNRQFLTSSTVAKDSPTHYDINGNTNGDPNIDLYPVPDAVEYINFNLVLPQDDFTDTDDDMSLTVPHWPVVLGAYMKALSERGEDGGQNFGEAMNDYNKALSDAIAIDAGQVPDELIWEVV